jgi:hypothetical protein
MSAHPVGLTVTLAVHQGRAGAYVKAVVYGTHSGRYRSEIVTLMPLPGGALPEDPEEVIALALSAVSGAVYHS